MTNNGETSPSLGRITRGPKENSLVVKTVEFIKNQLASWRVDPERKEEQSEDLLNAQLFKFLEVKARYGLPMVCFSREEPQGGHRRVDGSASPTETTVINAKPYTIYDPFLGIEGKRLPSPSKKREREYVKGHDRECGGIERFKTGLYGSPLEKPVIVGYIQKGTADHWHKKINIWIEELVKQTKEWSADEILGPLDRVGKGVTECHSSHKRPSNKIDISHLWVKMERKNTTEKLG